MIDDVYLEIISDVMILLSTTLLILYLSNRDNKRQDVLNARYEKLLNNMFENITRLQDNYKDEILTNIKELAIAISKVFIGIEKVVNGVKEVETETTKVSAGVKEVSNGVENVVNEVDRVTDKLKEVSAGIQDIVISLQSITKITNQELVKKSFDFKESDNIKKEQMKKI